MPIFAAALVGMLTKCVPAVAAKIVLTAGLALIAIGDSVPPFDKVVASMQELHFLGILFSWLMILMLVISELAPRETELAQEDGGAVDMSPWTHTRVASGVLMLPIVAIDITVADA